MIKKIALTFSLFCLLGGLTSVKEKHSLSGQIFAQEISVYNNSVSDIDSSDINYPDIDDQNVNSSKVDYSDINSLNIESSDLDISDSESPFSIKDETNIFSPRFSSAVSRTIIRGQNYGSYWDQAVAQNNGYAANSGTAVYVAQNNSYTGPSGVNQAPTLNPISNNTLPAATTSTGGNYSPIVTPTLNDTVDEFGTTSSNSGLMDSQAMQTVKKFWTGFSAEGSYILPGGKKEGLGVGTVNLRGQFSVPCKILPSDGGNHYGYFFIGPGFRYDYWDTPEKSYMRYDMPSSTFNAFVDFGVSPKFSDVALDAWVRVGVASSFDKITSKSVYIQGQATGTLKISDTVDGVLGAWYLDRQHIKLLPIAGIIWRPNEKNEWLLLFPNPRFNRYLNRVGEYDWWAYIQGTYEGGGFWTITDQNETFRCDYNDYQIGVGLQCESLKGCAGCMEVGGSFGRELYTRGNAWLKPGSSIYFKVSFRR